MRYHKKLKFDWWQHKTKISWLESRGITEKQSWRVEFRYELLKDLLSL